jgi:hypothetical protein
VETVNEALNLMKRQTEPGRGLRHPGGIRVTEEREIYAVRQRLQRYAEAIAAILRTASSRRCLEDAMPLEDVRRTVKRGGSRVGGPSGNTSSDDHTPIPPQEVSKRMARPYASEMAKLADTFAWAMASDLAPLRAAVKTAGLSPLLALGSGGSLSVAHALASLHQRSTGNLATTATPLEAIAQPLSPNAAIWLLSASGGNVDILAAYEALVAREPRQLAVLCGKGSRHHDLDSTKSGHDV